jgi:hypothetical protein
MLSRGLAALCASVVMAFAGQAAGAVLYDNFNSGPFATNAGNISDYRRANSFTLASDSTISGADFGVWLELPAAALASFQWGIYDSSPFSGGALLGGATVLNPTQTGTLPHPFGVNQRVATFSIAPLDLAAGTYWLEIDAAAGNNGRAFWEVSGGPSSAWVDAGPLPCTPDPTNCGSAASNSFRILGDAAPSSNVTPIPEPGVWALMILGFLGVGVVIRRQRAYLAAS